MPEKRVKSFTVRQVGVADSDPHYELRYVFVAPGVPEFPVVTHLREYMRHRRSSNSGGRIVGAPSGQNSLRGAGASDLAREGGVTSLKVSSAEACQSMGRAFAVCADELYPSLDGKTHAKHCF